MNNKKILSHTQVALVDTLSGAIAQTYAASEIEDETLDGLILQMEQQHQALADALNRERADVALEGSHKARIITLRRIRYQLLNATLSADDTIRQAGETLFDIFSRHFDMTSLYKNINRSTAYIHALLSDLKTDAAKSAMEKISSLKTDIDRLTAQLVEIELLMHRNAVARAQQGPNATRLAADLIRYINDNVLAYIQGIAMGPNAKAKTLAEAVMGHVAYSNERVRQHRAAIKQEGSKSQADDAGQQDTDNNTDTPLPADDTSDDNTSDTRQEGNRSTIGDNVVDAA